MTIRDLGVAMVRLGAESMRAHMLGDPVLVRRHGFAVARRDGLWCFSSRRIEEGVFNHVSGYGTFAEGTQRAIDTVLRYYAPLGRPLRVEVLEPAVSRAEVRLLERNGFTDRGAIFQCHLRTTAGAPRDRAVPDLEVGPVRPADAVRYAKLAKRGFGEDRSPIGRVFERGWIRQIRRGPPVTAFMGRLRGTPAATGVFHRGPIISGLYSGSVLPRYRGRGIQNAMIGARLGYGWSRGIRAFYSWTDPESASAHNLRDEGFVTRFEVHMYRRDA